MATLKTNYKDDILDTSVNTQRKYRMVNNADGTISLEDVTVYTQNGDSFGAADINKTNQEVLDLNSSLEIVHSNNFGNRIEITKYTSDFFICPSDGYIAIAFNAVLKNMEIQVNIYGSNNDKPVIYFCAGGTTTIYATTSDNAIFVRKGMRAKVSYNNSGSDGFVQFYPII